MSQQEPMQPMQDLGNSPQKSSSQAANTSQDNFDALAQVDELTLRPRTSSIILSVIFAAVFLAIGFAVYWFGVHTTDGQMFEDVAIMNFSSVMPSWLSFGNMASALVIGISFGFGVIAAIVAAIRRRWWLLGQLAIYAAAAFAAGRLLKPILPRPFLIQTDSSPINSAPSGHTMLAAAAGLALICAMPHAARAVATIIATVFTSIVGISVIYDRWHRPADVLMAIAIAGACSMLMLAFTRRSGMDKPGDRVSSPTIQITATMLITFGVSALAYTTYVLWQVWPGLSYGSSWAAPGICTASATAVVGFACLINGMVLMMRQITAAPLSRLGLIGAAPAPPKR